ncbi:hypothetical protein AAFF_G00223540 [Aldrovandia affinis]|uniref:Uncharacterized protein n=1 Tax=Aldrovandia affinis TaxID=143900 RepID=A0AAD7TAR5_9TELE|nr:hypothetical protein AAFF_G00223540 [Aldrovandia affinis]
MKALSSLSPAHISLEAWPHVGGVTAVSDQERENWRCVPSVGSPPVASKAPERRPAHIVKLSGGACTLLGMEEEE